MRITAFGPGGNVKLTSFLGEVAKRLEDEAQKRTYAGANAVRREWLRLLSGPRTGRYYRIPGTHRKRRSGAARRVRAQFKKGQSATAIGAASLLATAGRSGFYRASAPGESPAVALGDLRRSVRAVSKRSTENGNWEAIVGSDMQKAPWLEYGTGRAGAGGAQTDLPPGYSHGSSHGMAPRPSLRPALEHTRAEVKGILGRRII